MAQVETVCSRSRLLLFVALAALASVTKIYVCLHGDQAPVQEFILRSSGQSTMSADSTFDGHSETQLAPKYTELRIETDPIAPLDGSAMTSPSPAMSSPDDVETLITRDDPIRVDQMLSALRPNFQSCIVGHLADHSRQEIHRCSPFASIRYDLRHWKDNSVKLDDFWQYWKKKEGHKGVAIAWDGQYVRMVTHEHYAHLCAGLDDQAKPSYHRMISSATNLPLGDARVCRHKPQNRRNLLLTLTYVARACKRANLPPFEFLLHFRDNAIMDEGQGPPVFGISKTRKHRDILIPNVVRPATNNMTLHMGLTEFPRTVTWDAKIEKLFWRGSPMGVKEEKDIKINLRAKLACAHRGGPPNFTQASEMLDAGFPYSEAGYKKQRVWRDLFKRCSASFVPYEGASRYKYLAVLQGTGYTARFKDFLSVDSLVFKNYWNAGLYEWFEGGLRQGVHLFDMRNSPIDVLIDVARWSRAHDSHVRRMVRIANAYIRWAFATDTLDCYLWRLLRDYGQKLSYDASQTGVVSTLFEQRSMRGEMYDTVRVHPPEVEAQEKFARRCKIILDEERIIQESW